MAAHGLRPDIHTGRWTRLIHPVAFSHLFPDKPSTRCRLCHSRAIDLLKKHPKAGQRPETQVLWGRNNIFCILCICPSAQLKSWQDSSALSAGSARRSRLGTRAACGLAGLCRHFSWDMPPDLLKHLKI